MKAKSEMRTGEKFVSGEQVSPVSLRTGAIEHETPRDQARGEVQEESRREERRGEREE